VLEPTTLSVRGEATLEVPADYAVVSVQVTGRDADRELAMGSVADVAEGVRAAVAAATGVRRSALSRLRVVEVQEWDDAKRQQIRGGWEASMSGSLELDAAEVGQVAAAVVQAGAQVTWVDWRVEQGNPGHREVRRLAVLDAARAAADFAAALGGSAGTLLQLADPGLLESGGGGFRNAGATPAFRAMSNAGAGSGEVQLDPQPILLECVVEARYLLGVS